MPAEKILIIEDDPINRAIVERSLQNKGFETSTAQDGVGGWDMFQAMQPHLVILDLVLPRLSGWEVCRLIRAAATTPIMIVSARDAEQDIVRGLELGADDYLIKPVRPVELLARVEALLRRARMSRLAPGQTLCFDQGKLVLDPDHLRVIVRGTAVDLTPIESKLLVFLAQNADRVLTSETIFNYVWPYDSEAGLNTIKWHIWQLRSKIEAEPGKPRYIQTERGIGYKFNSEPCR